MPPHAIFPGLNIRLLRPFHGGAVSVNSHNCYLSGEYVEHNHFGDKENK